MCRHATLRTGALTPPKLPPAASAATADAELLPMLHGMSAVVSGWAAAASSAQKGVFDAATPPQVPISTYLTWWSAQVRCREEVFTSALAFITRSGVPVTPGTAHRLLLAALVVSCKFHDDFYYSNSVYASIGGVSVSELQRLEAALCVQTDWKLFVSNEEHATLKALCLESSALSPKSTLFCSGVVHICKLTPATPLGLVLSDARIVGVVPGSAAEQAGLRRGMLIAAVNDSRTTTKDEVLQSLSLSRHLTISVLVPQ